MNIKLTDIVRLRLVIFILLLPGALFIWKEYKLSELFSQSEPKFQIAGNRSLSKEELISLLRGKSLVPLTALSYDEIEKKLLAHPRVLSVSITKKPKNTTFIQIEERTTEFIINSGDTLYEVDSEFRILSTDDVRSDGVLILSGEFTPEDGKFSGSVIREFAASVTRALKLYPGLKNRLSEVELRSDGNVIAYTRYPSHIRVNAGIALESQQVRKLYAALAYFENKNIKAKTLDLRGDDAVFQ